MHSTVRSSYKDELPLPDDNEMDFQLGDYRVGRMLNNSHTMRHASPDQRQL